MSPTLKIKKPNGLGDPPSPPTPAPGPSSSGEAESRLRTLIPPKAPKNSKNSARVLMTVLDGKIEWGKMTSDSRKAFEELFKDKEFLRQFGLTGAEQVFKAEQMEQLYDGVSMMYQTVVGMFLRWPAPALRLLAYSEDQKKMLGGPTAALANEFAPEFLKKHSTLIIWASVFGAVTQKNFLEASVEAKKLMAQKQPINIAARGAAPPANAAAPAAPKTAPASSPADVPAPRIPVPFSMPSAAEIAATETMSQSGGESLEEL